MKFNFKKSKYKLVIFTVVLILLFTIYLVKGEAAAWAWVIAIFIIGPVGLLLSLIQLIILILRCIKKKKKKTVIIHFIASLLWAFPILILIGVVFIPFPDNEKSSTNCRLKIPVEGDVVLFGGKDYPTHAVWPSERYAYDILEEPYNTGNLDLYSYGIYGKNVLAPIRGEIIKAHDGEEDIRPNTEEFTSALGNYIFMKIKETDTYLIFAHLKSESICVRKGDVVDVGTVLAKVGNSGTTSEPHLHIQHQKNNPCNTTISIAAKGLPITFEK